MDFRSLSFPEVPLIKTQPPGPRSKEYLDFQSAHEDSAVSYLQGMPMALSRARGATVYLLHLTHSLLRRFLTCFSITSLSV